jgi:hypothetical protein
MVPDLPHQMMKSCTFIVYTQKYQIWLENSTHTPSYGEVTFQFHVLSSDSLVRHLWSQNDVITT